MDEHVDVLIVGAGITGLRCADLLLRSDSSLKVVVVEALSRVGGRLLEYSSPDAPGLLTISAASFWQTNTPEH